MKLLTRCCVCHQSGYVVCPSCQRYLRSYHDGRDGDIGLSHGVIGWHYTTLIKHLIHRLKYGKGKTVGKFLGSKLTTIIQTTTLSELIQLYPNQVWVTSVPIHWFKYYCSRGYNQAELIAHQIAMGLELPYYNLLSKYLWTRSQVRIKRSSRLTNIIDSFRARTVVGVPQVIVLVDDIITTGATMRECTRVLHEMYPQVQIRGVCVARNR